MTTNHVATLYLSPQSLDEWTTFYKCHRPEEMDSYLTTPASAAPYKSSNSSLSSLPSAFDWRERRKVTKIKSQVILRQF